MGKNILWVIASGVAAGVALPLVVLHSDDLVARFSPPAPPPVPEVAVRSWEMRSEKIVQPQAVSKPVAALTDAPVERDWHYWNGGSSSRGYRHHSSSHSRHGRPARRSAPRLSPDQMKTSRDTDLAAWQDADRMLRIERQSRGGE